MVDHLKITRKHEFQLNRFDDDSHFKSIFLKYRKKTTKRKKTNAASVIRNSFLVSNSHQSIHNHKIYKYFILGSKSIYS